MHKLDINQVYNGDSNLMIKSIESESVDLVIIDPPYKIRKKTDEINSLAKAVKKYNEELQRDNLINEYDKSILEELVRVMKRINIYIWCNGEQIPSYIDFFDAMQEQIKEKEQSFINKSLIIVKESRIAKVFNRIKNYIKSLVFQN